MFSRAILSLGCNTERSVVTGFPEGDFLAVPPSFTGIKKIKICEAFFRERLDLGVHQAEKAVVGTAGTPGFGRAAPHHFAPGTKCSWHVGKARDCAVACFEPSRA